MEDEEIDLRHYWEILRKRWQIVVVIPLIAALASGLISFFLLKPIYQASTTLIVGEKASSDDKTAADILQYNVLMANQQLAKTYGAIVQSRTVEQAVIDDLKLPLTIEELDKLIGVAQVKTTEILDITVDNTDPKLAASIANTMATEFTRAVIDIKKVDSVSIVDKAVTPDKPVKPKKTLNILIAFVVGLLAGIGLAFLLEYLDNTVKTSADAEKLLGIPVLGIIPNYESTKLN